MRSLARICGTAMGGGSFIFPMSQGPYFRVSGEQGVVRCYPAQFDKLVKHQQNSPPKASSPSQLLPFRLFFDVHKAVKGREEVSREGRCDL